ncbi:histone-like nucleoid-structuring protein Lsr2 [Amycolatopsis australiensis]|uniref:Lsr2 protein n=1 Tax=Amycolatopsis australiensis TaxID=546364 RepID=A0A1K1SQT6_9PSEU|nr:Lsr2 family protein [Amycolatopsis australiensis]SFW86245.1 Lsr2 protein [Amycolatopsis australiensis]
MAQKVLVELVDDLDGGAATQTVPFALDGVSYEIDLSAENAQALRDEFARYVDAGQRTGGRRRKLAPGQPATSNGSGPRTSASRMRSRRTRDWAQANGYEVSERGRIPDEVRTAFEAAEATRTRLPAQG